MTEEWWPSRDMQPKINAAVMEVLRTELEWEAVEKISAPVYAYITELLNKRGPDSFLVNEEGPELTLGIAVWDENHDDLLASEQVSLSTILRSAAFGDEFQLAQIIAATRRSLDLLEAPAQGIETQRAEIAQQAPSEG